MALKIIKARETMTARERVAKTFAFEKTDRVTIGYDSNPIACNNLCDALGIPRDDDILLKKTLGVDYAEGYAHYTGPPIHKEIPGRQRSQENGTVMRYIENPFGGYWDYCDFPLQNADDETIAGYPFPNPDHYDYAGSKERIDYLLREGFSVHLGNPGAGDILNTSGMLFCVEEALVRFATGDEAILAMTDNRIAFQLGRMERLLDRNKGKIDFIWLGEDLGTQHTPLIGMDMYRKYLKPRHQKFVDLAKSYGLPTLIHTCGSSSWVYEEFIEMGITGVDTLQPEASNMSPAYLTEHFGGRLNFRGCISTAGPLAYGTPEETTAYCRETLETMMPHRGYHFAPTHAIQDNSPAENIVAMYNAAHQYGKYS